jgi:hypothetical protein
MTVKQKVDYYKIPKRYADFMYKREGQHTKQIESSCLHPKNTGIKKKDTTFFPGCCNVRFDRKTLPKKGKSILNGCFIEKKGIAWLVWETRTRCLLGLVYDEDRLEIKTKEWKERFNELNQKEKDRKNMGQ